MANLTNRSTICLFNYEVEFPKENDSVITTKGYNKNKIIKNKMIMYPLSNMYFNRINNNTKIHIRENKLDSSAGKLASLKNKVFFSKDVIKNKKNVIINISYYSNRKTYYLIEQLNITNNEKNYKAIIQQLYNDIYLTYNIKHSFAKNKENYKIPDLISIVNDLIDKNIKILKEYYEKYNSLVNNLDTTIDLNNNSNINRCNIFNIESNHKVIIIGDTHGSFHTFFRIFLRLRKENILNEKLELTNGTKLIILGDVLDRGQFALEILFLLFLLMKINNNETELNVIFNRGNHEHPEVYKEYGFNNELRMKNIKEKKKFYYTFKNNLNSFFCSTCTAIILKHKNTKYWLCHGGIPYFQSIKKKNNLTTIGKFENHKVIILGKKFQTQISWNDFTTSYRKKLSERNDEQGIIFEIGLKNIFKFLHKYNFDFIIRAHQDHNCNSWLLSSLLSDSGSEILPLDFKLAKTIISMTSRICINTSNISNIYHFLIIRKFPLVERYQCHFHIFILQNSLIRWTL